MSRGDRRLLGNESPRALFEKSIMSGANASPRRSASAIARSLKIGRSHQIKGSSNMRMKWFVAGLLLVVAAVPAFPQNKDMLRLQADMITLQQQVKQLQSSADENNAS